MDCNFVSSFLLSKKNIFYNELKVKHLKYIYKCLIGDELNFEIIFININNILQQITSLNVDEINNLNFLDYFLLLLEIRCTSIGNLIYIQPHDDENTKIEINIYKLIDILNELNTDKLLLTDNIDSIQIFYKLPTIKNLLNINSSNEIYTFFVEKIILNDVHISLVDLSVEDCEKVLEKLPVKVTTQILKKVSRITKIFNETNLLSTTFGLQDKTLLLNLNIENLINVLKIVFGEQLMTLYENIFMLCKVGNFTPEYIENCTPGEYILFVKKLDALINQPKGPSADIDFGSNEAFDTVNHDLL
jgi:hypothetical protein